MRDLSGPDEPLDPYLDREVRVVAEELRGMAVPGDTGDTGEPQLPPLEDLLRDGIRAAHHLLRALAIEGEVVATVFGADPLTPALHALAAAQRAAFTAFVAEIALDPPVTLAEPSEEYVAAIAARCRPEEAEDSLTW